MSIYNIISKLSPEDLKKFDKFLGIGLRTKSTRIAKKQYKKINELFGGVKNGLWF